MNLSKDLSHLHLNRVNESQGIGVEARVEAPQQRKENMIEIKQKKYGEWTDEENYVCSLMGWLVANAGDDLTEKYLDHRNRRSFKYSLDKIDKYLDKSGWWKYGNNKYWTPLHHENEDNWQKLEKGKHG